MQSTFKKEKEEIAQFASYTQSTDTYRYTIYLSVYIRLYKKTLYIYVI